METRQRKTREQIFATEDQRLLWDLFDPGHATRQLWHRVNILMASLTETELWRRAFLSYGLTEVHGEFILGLRREPAARPGPCLVYTLCPRCETSQIIRSLLPSVKDPTPVPVTPEKSEEVKELEGELEKLRRAIADTTDLSLDSDMFAKGFGNRLAPAQYRNDVIGTFLHHMQKLGDVALMDKRRALAYLRGPILADIESMWAAPEATPEEGERRALVEWMIKDPAPAEVLVGTEEYNEDERREFSALVLISGVDTSVQELTRRSAELGAGDKPNDR